MRCFGWHNSACIATVVNFFLYFYTLLQQNMLIIYLYAMQNALFCNLWRSAQACTATIFSLLHAQFRAVLEWQVYLSVVFQLHVCYKFPRKSYRNCKFSRECCFFVFYRTMHVIATTQFVFHALSCLNVQISPDNLRTVDRSCYCCFLKAE